MRKQLLAGAAAVGLILAPLALLAQTGTNITNRTLPPTNTVDTSIAGPGGQAQVSTVAQFRNATALKLFSGSGAQTYTATTSDCTLFWVGTAPTSWTITTPASPFDGEILTIATDTTLTTRVTLTANTGQTLNTTYTNQTINGSASVEFQFSLSTNKWYELR